MKRVLPILLAALAVASAGARKIADFFVAAPMYEAAPYIDANMRMDLLDYFRSDLPSKTTNMFDEPAAIISEDAFTLRVKAGRDVMLDYGMAFSGSDTLLIVIETLPTPMPDSKVSLFNTDWKPAHPAEIAPTLSDWLSDEGRRHRKRVEDILPFITYEARFREDANLVELSNTVGKYFADSDSIAKELERYLSPSLVYKFNGKTFVPDK